MIKMLIPDFSIDQICGSGQCFRIREEGNGFYSVIAGEQYLELKQSDEDVTFDCTEEEFYNDWEHYFDLGTDYGSYIRMVDPEDTYLQNAVKFGSGIRILNQDLWEMIISFIISQQNHIRRIRKCIDTLCEKYGDERFSKAGRKFFTFPTPEALASVTEEELRACNLGYRSSYLIKTASSIACGEVKLGEIKKMDYPSAQAELMRLSGIGKKVADCVCLFGLHHLDAFPVDTHIRQIFDRHYPDGFPYEDYPGIAGLIQQYLFYYDLKNPGL